MLIRRIARPLLSAVFIGQGIETLRNPKVTLDAAQTAVTALQTLPDPVGSKIPSDPETAARINAAVQVGGGLLLATGRLPRIASAALAFTVIPGSLGGHLFWNEHDPELKAQKRRDLLTDLSLLGGLIIASADTAGKPSLGWRGRRAASRLSDKVSAALPLDNSDGAFLESELAERIGHGLHAGAERSRELASTAAERGAPLVEAARKRGGELASTAAEKSAPVVKKARKKARKRGAQLAEAVREHGAELADTARERGSELADTARERGSEWADIARERGSEWADIARERGSELGERAYERGSELADTAVERGGELAHRGRVKARHWH
ncbi:MAG TPA: DoxX family membrane protein [Mycobacterium sp.]|uniref:DoxX family membrane protein n=1 Tax=Mycobacterium sp. TaxID=1785 RepID=UPI002C9BD52E|nr:DoxX family membrane protein [Mycobacterium sp.]HXO82738.1 DoxX family membrane protein [Mycobacterium sp.]